MSVMPHFVPYFRLGEAAVCADCAVVFSNREPACPTCASEHGIYLIEKKARNDDAPAADGTAEASQARSTK